MKIKGAHKLKEQLNYLVGSSLQGLKGALCSNGESGHWC